MPLLASDPERAVVAGGVMQPWKLAGGEDPPALDAPALQAFAEPGWVKTGFDLVIEPDRHRHARDHRDARDRHGRAHPRPLRPLLAVHPRRLGPDPARHAPRGRAARGGRR